ncbi:MAG: choice-of-anchor P family protein [Steroidobacteraceae bacterium]
MQSYKQKSFFAFRADANALGGFLEQPFEKIIPTLAPVSLSPVGGFATARSEAFNLDEIVSCSAAYTRVSGREQPADGSVSILVAATVERLNILEVLTAERIVAQVSISITNDNEPLKFSLAGTSFEGLRLAGRDSRPKLNSRLHQPGSGACSQGLTLTCQDIRQTGQEPPDDGTVLCSLVDGFDGAGSNEGSGHIVEIPGFGRIILGQLVVSSKSVQLVAIRAELGCPIVGQIGVCAVGGGGGTENAVGGGGGTEN